MDTRKVEQRIAAELAGVLSSLGLVAQSAATVELDQASVGRVSRIDAIQQQAMAIGFQGRLQVRKRKLEAALGRIASGRYGLCCDCQSEIESERLEADPATVFCLECAAQRESK
jgi:DnaK suppressor protein